MDIWADPYEMHWTLIIAREWIAHIYSTWTAAPRSAHAFTSNGVSLTLGTSAATRRTGSV